MAVGRTDRLDDVFDAVRKLADGRLCSTGPMEYAIVAALNGDRSHQESFRAALRERAELTTRRLNAIPGMSAVAPRAAFYSMPRVELPPGVTDEDYVLGATPRQGRALRLRLRLRHAPRRRILPIGLPGVTGGARVDLRRHRRFHGRSSWRGSDPAHRIAAIRAESFRQPPRDRALRHRDDGAGRDRGLDRLSGPRTSCCSSTSAACLRSASARSCG